MFTPEAELFLSLLSMQVMMKHAFIRNISSNLSCTEFCQLSPGVKRRKTRNKHPGSLILLRFAILFESYLALNVRKWSGKNKILQSQIKLNSCERFQGK